MYAGHAAVALALKAREPRLHIIPLSLACFGPDLVEVALLFAHRAGGMAVYTHSVPAVIVGALIAAGLHAALRKPGAGLILAGWLLHWPADLLTGRKPFLAAVPLIGLDLYKLPPVDFVLEGIVIVIGCGIYGRRYARSAELRRTIVMLAAALIVIQGAVDVALSVMRTSPWTPSLAWAGRQTQLAPTHM